MKPVFADTFYFLAVVSPSDSAHEKALQFGEESKRPLLTTVWVLTEVADGLAGTRNRHLARQLFLDLHNDPSDQVELASQELFEKGLDLYHNRPANRGRSPIAFRSS